MTDRTKTILYPPLDIVLYAKVGFSRNFDNACLGVFDDETFFSLI